MPSPRRPAAGSVAAVRSALKSCSTLSDEDIVTAQPVSQAIQPARSAGQGAEERFHVLLKAWRRRMRRRMAIVVGALTVVLVVPFHLLAIFVDRDWLWGQACRSVPSSPW